MKKVFSVIVSSVVEGVVSTIISAILTMTVLAMIGMIKRISER